MANFKKGDRLSYFPSGGGHFPVVVEGIAGKRVKVRVFYLNGATEGEIRHVCASQLVSQLDLFSDGATSSPRMMSE